MDRRLLTLSVLLFAAIPARAAEPTPTEKELSALLRGLLLSHLPDPLVEADPGWGKQVPALIKPHEPRNQGVWRKVRVTALDPAKTLIVEVRNIRETAPATRAFDLLVGFDAEVDFTQQVWERGLRLYSGSTKARMKVWCALKCEVATRTEKKGLLPDVVFRLHVVSADLKYSGLDVIHTAGVGGDAAKYLGDALHSTLSTLRPHLEKDLLAKADAAIVKAGDHKEVRVGLGKLFNSGK
jgi:hypothetical protein